MKSCYVDKDTRSIADICDYYGRGLIITRINVPKEHRNKKHGSALLKRILADADAEGVVLWLEILESGGLTRTQLAEWYARYGFKNHGGVWRRQPVKV